MSGDLLDNLSCQVNDHKTIKAFATEKTHFMQYLDRVRIDKMVRF